MDGRNEHSIKYHFLSILRKNGIDTKKNPINLEDKKIRSIILGVLKKFSEKNTENQIQNKNENENENENEKIKNSFDPENPNNKTMNSNLQTTYTSKQDLSATNTQKKCDIDMSFQNSFKCYMQNQQNSKPNIKKRVFHFFQYFYYLKIKRNRITCWTL